MKKKIWEGARGGILTSMILVGSTIGGNSALAQTLPDYVSPAVTAKTASGMHIGHRFNSRTKINSLVVQLGLNPNDVQRELHSGKTIKQILQDNGITMDQLDTQ